MIRPARSTLAAGRHAAALCVAATVALATTSLPTRATPTTPFSNCPGRAVHLVVGAGAGSFPDQVARQLAEALAPGWGVPVVVENRPGAGGIAAMSAFAKAAPDGCTLALGTMSQLVFDRFLFRDLPFDVQRDLKPVGTLLSGGMMIVANPMLPAEGLPEVLELARRHPGSIDFAVPAAGSPPHVVLAELMAAAHATFTVVPYRSGADALPQLASGQVPLFIDAVPVVAAFVESGRLKPLAVTGEHRLARFPSVPTVAELGYPDFRGEAWIGLVARAGTPPPLVARLARDLAQAQDAPAMRRFLETSGARALRSTPGSFEALIRTEIDHWGPVVRGLGLQVQ